MRLYMERACMSEGVLEHESGWLCNCSVSSDIKKDLKHRTVQLQALS